MSLSDTQIRRLIKQNIDKPSCEVADRDGLSLRLSGRGSGTFQYRYRYLGKPRRMKIGSYPEISLVEARNILANVRAIVAQGLDPIQEKALERQYRSVAPTMSQLCEMWINDYAKDHRSRWEEVEQVIDKNITPFIGNIKVEDIKLRLVTEKVFQPMLQRDVKVQANKVLQLIKQILNFAVERGIIETNPCAVVTRRSVGGPEKARDRVLDYDEICLLWRRLETATMSLPVKLALKILLATAQRRGEITNAKWEHVDFKAHIWTIPAENSKNGRANEVPLSELAVDLFHQLYEIRQGSNWVMPSVKHADQPMSDRVISRAVKRWVEGEPGFPVEHWIDKFTPHDLRRTAATKMNELGVQPFVVESILNHSMQGVMAVYNHYRYFKESKAAMNMWGEKLNSVVSTECHN